MEDPKVLFADTTARRAELMKATERFKTSIQDSVDSIKGDAAETGKTVALVAGVALGVFLIANAILPKSDEYRYAEKYGERDDDDDEEEYDNQYNFVSEDADPRFKSKHQLVQEKERTAKKSAIGGLIGGLLTSVLTSIAREQLSNALTRFRSNNAIDSGTNTYPTESYRPHVPTQPAGYPSQV
ncbi:hypothetical protein F5984_15380 [Rudanella paleaurantiibacter]|uniref:Uncharacterized protein n=1 Tax=Rudanella paleaurantiibacter TaxID=2614655 RepID=A0A7J5TX85_9BACT|nr:hypothetical protein [Rudanella paleaurantiibacter]KAB7729033.1 hypothetical protein F5984_15380 [Rudanella paleaurantiibacter]